MEIKKKHIYWGLGFIAVAGLVIYLYKDKAEDKSETKKSGADGGDESNAIGNNLPMGFRPYYQQYIKGGGIAGQGYRPFWKWFKTQRKSNGDFGRELVFTF
ncbi:MAG TPA: hypothetical protein VN026_15965 [Bacteroidia bacterium]|jgi:hypothetical protein|nr:hypothetical protein [Bacteroidia bacterium]